MFFRQVLYPYSIALFLLFWAVSSAGQNLDDLQNRKQSASREIRYTNELLGRVSQNQKATLGKLRLINKQIDRQKELISVMTSEASLMQSFMDDNSEVLIMLSADLEKIRSEYAQMVRFAWKNRSAYDKVLFFLSSDNVNQAFRRFIYIKQYTDYRKKQAEVIASISTILERKTRDLERMQMQKEGLIREQETEKKKLDLQRSQQNLIARKLQSEKSDLQKKLSRQRQIEKDLEKEIQRIIEEEAAKSGKSGKPGFVLTPEQKTLGDNFEQNRNRLPWPVERGVITEKFGIHPHPVLHNVTVNNNGVNINTAAGSKARSVFSGEVSRVFGIAGGNVAVILRHGPYLTVYSNLVDVTVKKGDQVGIRQNLGTIFTDRNEGDKTVLKFQIWKENKKLNPEDWLSL